MPRQPRPAEHVEQAEPDPAPPPKDAPAASPVPWEPAPVGPYAFISYAHTDATDYVIRLAEALAPEVRVWFDHHLVSGDRWDLVLRERVDRANAVIVVMSPAGAESAFVRLEIGRARFRGRPLHPVLLAGDPYPGLETTQHEPTALPPSAALVDRLLSQLTAAPTHREGAGVIVGNLPPRNTHFVGREELLLKLEGEERIAKWVKEDLTVVEIISLDAHYWALITNSSQRRRHEQSLGRLLP